MNLILAAMALAPSSLAFAQHSPNEMQAIYAPPSAPPRGPPSHHPQSPGAGSPGPRLTPAGWSMAAAMAAHIPSNATTKVGAGYKLQRFLRAMTLDTAEAHFTWNGTWMPRDAATLVAGAAAKAPVSPWSRRGAASH